MRQTEFGDIEFQLLCGSYPVKKEPDQIFPESAIDFLTELSEILRTDGMSRNYPDILSFAFWCRKSNIEQMRQERAGKHLRLGRGMIYHIAPSNVPVNFAFSLAFGMLSGNANVVRVSAKEFPQTKILCDIMEKLFKKDKFRELGNRNAIVRFGHAKELNDHFSAECEGRVVWGGDDTIRVIGQSPISPRAVEIHFADRFSFGVIDGNAVLDATEDELLQLAEGFYNDTYLMDQMSCSTPHLLLWKNEAGRDLEIAKNRFWNKVLQTAEKYELSDSKVSDKITEECLLAAGRKISNVKKYGNVLYRNEISQLDEETEKLRGHFGNFFESDIQCLDDIKKFVTARTQTCLIFGIEQTEVREVILKNHLLGIDRVVPFGNSLNMNPTWDGYDIVGILSRVIGTE